VRAEAELRQRFAARFAQLSAADWSGIFFGTDACVAPVRTMTGASGDPELAARSGKRDGRQQRRCRANLSIAQSTLIERVDGAKSRSASRQVPGNSPQPLGRGHGSHFRLVSPPLADAVLAHRANLSGPVGHRAKIKRVMTR
jgi:hypothetical protein